MKLFYLGILSLLFIFVGCTTTGNAPAKNITTNNTATGNNTYDKSNLVWTCSGSICSAGIFKCDNNIYSKPGKLDLASLYLNGSTGEIIARCGGNILPINPDACQTIDQTCDYSKQADPVPDALKTNS